MTDQAESSAAASTRAREADGEGQDQDVGNPVKKSKRVGTKHISQACDVCKARKGRCDGVRPICGTCSIKKLNCGYGKKDGRKNRAVVLDIRDRIDQLVGLLNTSGHGLAVSSASQPPDPQSVDASSPMSTGQVGPSDSLTLFSSAGLDDQNTMQRNSLAIPNVSMTETNFTFDSTITDLAMSSTSPVTSRSIPIPEKQQAGSPFASSQGSHISQVEGRLKRPEGGSLMQFGPTSLWSYARETQMLPLSASNDQVDQRPGDYINWAQHLPPELPITKAVHDAAISIFGAYYAPWCRVVDMPAFMRDMDACNLVTRLPRSTPPPTRTAAYSPLLHNCILYLGLHLQRSKWPDMAQSLDNMMDKHFAGMVIGETENPNPSTLRAFILFATCVTDVTNVHYDPDLMISCMNVRKEMSARNTGYIYFGMAFAAVQALGVNLNCDHLLISGQITDEERDLRNDAYWTFYQQDILRAIAVGRPPMLSNQSDVVLPRVNPAADAMPWFSTPFGKTSIANGLPGMVSTVFHWSSRLHCILRTVMLNPPYSVMAQGLNNESQVMALAPMLESWYRDQPFSQPALHPVPHALIMHMLYHVTNIYLFRPYYRSQLDITPSPSHRCDQAATSTLELLRVYEAQHGVKNSTATLIPIIFATATVQLLRIVSHNTEPPVYALQLQTLDEIVWFMDQLTTPWIEARRGLEVIHTLRAEWLPGEKITGPTMQSHLPVPTLNQLEELPKELHEWLQGNSFWDIFNSDLQDQSTIPEIFSGS